MVFSKTALNFGKIYSKNQKSVLCSFSFSLNDLAFPPVTLSISAQKRSPW